MIQKAALTNLTKPLALQRFNEARSRTGAVVEMIEQDSHLWTVTIVWDDTEAVTFKDLEAFDETITAPGQEPVPLPMLGTAPKGDLGSLSRKYESNGKPGAVGFDTNGGFSYGTYQIATRPGTMIEFIKYLNQDLGTFASQLKAAGGAKAAGEGAPEFRDAWTRLAADPKFACAQHNFIEETHYRPFVKKLLDDLSLDVAMRSDVLRDVVWSTAVQLGSSTPVIKNALIGEDARTMLDRMLIQSIYAERSKVNKYFPSSSAQVKAALLARFGEELGAALARL